MQPKVAKLNGPVVESVPTPAEIQSARSFLRGRTFNRAGEIQPLLFAAAAKETGASYTDLLGVIARSYNQGQNQSAQREADISAAAQGAK